MTAVAQRTGTSSTEAQVTSEQELKDGTRWLASWSASPTAAYPTGFTLGQPDLSVVFPGNNPQAIDQSFRVIVRPDLWSDTVRFRFSNRFGTQPIVIGRATVGLQKINALLFEETNTPITFREGQSSVTIPAGKEILSDRVSLKFVEGLDTAEQEGRKLAVSFLC